MYLKKQNVKKANGKTYTYYRLVQSYREQGTDLPPENQSMN